MTDINKKIIQMIKENKSMKEISSILGMTEKQLYKRIKFLISYGYQLTPNYSYNSDIHYKLDRKFKNEDNTVRIKMSSSDKEFRCLVVSDLHIGNARTNIDLVNRVYEYASRNNINIILNCGDILEGVHTQDNKKIWNIYDQIETFIKTYPYDKNINNFMILGNHDYHSLHYDCLDISKRIENARYDIIPIGYGKGIVRLKEDSLVMEHKLSVVDTPNIGSECSLALVGHGHMMKTKFYDKLYICIPTLSSVSPDKTKEVIPGFIDLTIDFENGYFEFVKAKHMIFVPQICQASESRCRVKELYKEKYINGTKKNGR